MHGVDVEGRRAGIDGALVALLGRFACETDVSVTYAGGVRSIADLELVKSCGGDKASRPSLHPRQAVSYMRATGGLHCGQRAGLLRRRSAL